MLSVSAVGWLLVVEPIVVHAPAHGLATLVNSLYVIGDLALAALTVAVLGLHGWRAGRAWLGARRRARGLRRRRTRCTWRRSPAAPTPTARPWTSCGARASRSWRCRRGSPPPTGVRRPRRRRPRPAVRLRPRRAGRARLRRRRVGAGRRGRARGRRRDRLDGPDGALVRRDPRPGRGPPPRGHRRPHRAAQPPPPRAPAARGARRRARPPGRRSRCCYRPRPLQGAQRHARPPRRRHRARADRAAAARGAARGDMLARLGGDEFAASSRTPPSGRARRRRLARGAGGGPPGRRHRRPDRGEHRHRGVPRARRRRRDAHAARRRRDVPGQGGAQRARLLRGASATATRASASSSIGELRDAIGTDAAHPALPAEARPRQRAHRRRRGARALDAPRARPARPRARSSRSPSRPASCAS